MSSGNEREDAREDAPDMPVPGNETSIPPVPPPPPAPPAPMSTPPAGTPVAPYSAPGTVSQDDKNMALISTLGMIIVGFLSPLIVYLMTKDDPSKQFANAHAKAGLNFSITLVAGIIVSGILMFVLVGFFTMLALMGWSIWVIIAGAIQASNGEEPNYPLVPSLIK